MIDDKNTIPASDLKAGNEDKKSLSGEKAFPVPKASPGEWIEANWLWIVAHIFNFVYAWKCFHEEDDIQIFSVVIFMCIIFVQLYTDPIKPLPLEGSDQDEKNKIEEKRSQQRNKWMKFAYSFMLLSLWLTFYPFTNPIFENKQVDDKSSPNQVKKPEETTEGESGSNPSTATEQSSQFKQNEYLRTLRERPIAIFIGCTLDSKAKNLRCEELKKENVINPVDENQSQPQATPPVSIGQAWVINIGGYIEKCNPDNSNNEYGKSPTCEVREGLLIPLYFIILALMGGSISLTRRLPELQKQAGSEHIATERQPKLSQYEFREHLIFQMVQFISAPFLAILAYYLIEPSNTTNAVVLAFAAGFASETILLMVRSLANKITPANNAAPQYGAVTGVVTFGDKDPNLAGKPVDKIEVSLSGSPQIQSITDAQGFYMLGNVPVGDHSILFTNKEKGVEIKEIVKIERAQAIVKKNVTIVEQGSGQEHK